MEAQFRRFWHLRKSVKKSTKPESLEVPQVPVRSDFNSYEATASAQPPDVGSLPLKPSHDAKPRRPVGHSKTQSAGFQNSRTEMDKDSHSRTKSFGGIRPILVGISRPLTAESMQKDVKEVGNVNVNGDRNKAPAPSGPRLCNAAFQPEPRRVPKRYVDIMAFAVASGKHLEGYNEEIAARNLDLKAVANESATTTYVPESKFQEEVAARNASFTIDRYQAATPLQPSPEGRRSDSLKGRTRFESATYETPQAYRPPGTAAPARLRSMQDSKAHHSRTGNLTSKGSTQLPTIRQELSLEEAQREIRWLANQKRRGVPDPGQATAESMKPPVRYPSMHIANTLGNASQTGPLSYIPKTTTRMNESRPIADGNSRDHGKQIYNHPYETLLAENTDFATQRSEMKTEQVPTLHLETTSPQYQSEELSYGLDLPPSRVPLADRGRRPSSLSHRTDASGRTFMDLTGDEMEYPDSEDSPVLAHASTDLLRVHRAQVASPNSKLRQFVAVGSDTSDYEAPSARSSHESTQHLRRAETFSGFQNAHNKQPLAFSAVTTVSSMSPAVQPISKFSSAAGSRKTSHSRERTEESVASRSSSFSDITRPGNTNENAHQGQAEMHSWESQEHRRAPVSHADNNLDARQGHHVTVQTPQKLYASPESLNSGDFINPSRSFGVITRDFVPTPSRQTTMRPRIPMQKSHTGIAGRPKHPELVRHNSQPNVAHEQKSSSRRYLGFEHKPTSILGSINELPVIAEPDASPPLQPLDVPAKEPTASSFDEAEFSRKQAEARRALLRLRNSLEEQYDMSYGADSIAHSHVVGQLLGQTQKPQSVEKKSAVAPTSIYYEKKDYQSRAKTNRPLPIRTASENIGRSSSSYSFQRPGLKSFAQSFHSAVTVPPDATAPALNGHMTSSSAGSANHSSNYTNGASNTVSIPTLNLPNPPFTPVLPSPSGTEVSLSSFPMPNAAPQSFEDHGNIPTASPERPTTARMRSTRSNASSITSVYSIPHHMVPTRQSSR